MLRVHFNLKVKLQARKRLLMHSSLPLPLTSDSHRASTAVPPNHWCPSTGELNICNTNTQMLEVVRWRKKELSPAAFSDKWLNESKQTVVQETLGHTPRSHWDYN